VDTMIMKATELLLEQINENESVPQQLTLPVTPMLRNSTRRPFRGGPPHQT
jgi:DNA-binding LacI/PurR family transcriptional regulator